MTAGLPPAEELSAVVRRALAEDLGGGDVTTQATVAERTQGRALITQKAPGAIFGLARCAGRFRAARPRRRSAGAGRTRASGARTEAR